MDPATEVGFLYSQIRAIIKQSPDRRSHGLLCPGLGARALSLWQRNYRVSYRAMQPQSERLRKFKNSGSLSRHFVNKHIKPYSNDMHRECTICGEQLESKSALLNHAQRKHGIVSCLPLPALGLPLPWRPHLHHFPMIINRQCLRAVCARYIFSIGGDGFVAIGKFRLAFRHQWFAQRCLNLFILWQLALEKNNTIKLVGYFTVPTS